MTDLHIFRCKPIVKTDKKGEEIIDLAGIFQGVDCIYFLPVENYAFKFVEKNVELMIEHELIQLLLYQVEGGITCSQYDNLFPHLKDLEEFRRKK